MKYSMTLSRWLRYPKYLRHVGDYALQQQVSRAISIASQPVEATMNDSLADEIGTTKTGQDK